MRDESTDWSWDFTPQVDPQTPEAPPHDERESEHTDLPSKPSPKVEPAPAPSPEAEPKTPSSSQFAQFSPTAQSPDQGAYTRFQQVDAHDYQPGIMPFRPLRFGEFFDCAFRALRFNPQVMFGYSAVLMAFGIIAYSSLHSTFMRWSRDPLYDGMFATFGALVWQSLMESLLSIVIIGFLIFTVVGAIQGKRLSMGEVWHAMKGKILRLLGLVAVGGMLTMLGMVALTSILGLAMWAFVDEGKLTGVIFAFTIFIAVAALGVGCVLCATIAIPVLVVEHAGIFTSLKRAFTLLKGHFWRSLALLILAMTIVGTVASVVAAIATPGITFIFQSSGAITTEQALESASLMAAMVISSMLQVITTPFIAAFISLIYTDIRMRKEGLDIALIEASAAGR